MANIILHLIRLIQYQQRQIKWLLEFICKFIPLKQWMFDDSHSPKYQKFKVDQLPLFAIERTIEINVLEAQGLPTPEPLKPQGYWLN